MCSIFQWQREYLVRQSEKYHWSAFCCVATWSKIANYVYSSDISLDSLKYSNIQIVTRLNKILLSSSCECIIVSEVCSITYFLETFELPCKELTVYFPARQIWFSLPRLEVRFVHKDYNLSVENNITGIQLKSTKSRSTEDVGESTRIDVQMDFSEIHVHLWINVVKATFKLFLDELVTWYMLMNGCSISAS